MMMHLSVLLFHPETVLALKTGLRVVHFVGLALGVGGATLLELIVLRFFTLNAVSEERSRIVVFASGVVAAGVALLWLSGVGLLLHYGLFEPEKLGNPKIWAKLSIVGVLTLNGAFIHYFVLPHVRASVGRPLLDGIGGARRALLLTSGPVSAVSWYAPLLLGSVPQMNFAVPAWIILTAYGVGRPDGVILHGKKREHRSDAGDFGQKRLIPFWSRSGQTIYCVQ